MTLKEIIEKRNALNEQAKAMLDEAQTEVRSLTAEQEVEFNELIAQVEELDKQINEHEARSIENATPVVETNNDERGMEMDIKETELRALDQYIRRQDGEELRSMTSTSGSALVPTHLYDEIVEKLEEVAPIFSRVQKLSPVAGSLEILKETDIEKAGFVGEEADIDLKDFTLAKVKLEQRRAGSAVQLSQQLINDSGIDVVAYAKDVLYRRLGHALDRAMINGTKAANQFEGLVNAPAGCEVETMGSTAIAIEDFVGMLNKMHPTLQRGAVWIMSREIFNAVSLLKDGNGNFYLTRQLNVVDNAPEYRLLGLPILINDAVDKELVAGKKVVYLVNIEEAYAGMIKKDVEFKHINGDTANALRGSATLMLDMYADCVIKNEQAIRVLKVKA